MNAAINEKLEAVRQQLEGRSWGTRTPLIVAQVARMTDQNDHTGARVFLAQTFFPSNKKLIKAWEGIAALHEFHGSLSTGTKAARDELDDMLMKSLEHELSPEDYAAIHGAL